MPHAVGERTISGHLSFVSDMSKSQTQCIPCANRRTTEWAVFFFLFRATVESLPTGCEPVLQDQPPLLVPGRGPTDAPPGPAPPYPALSGGPGGNDGQSCSPGASPDQPKGDDPVRPTARPFRRGEPAGVMQPAPAHYLRTGDLRYRAPSLVATLRRPRPPAAVPSPTFIRAAAPGVLAPDAV